jgi:UPF0716 protein FxsA
VIRIFIFVIFMLFLIEIAGLLVVGQRLGTLSVLALLVAGIFFGVRLIKQSGGALAGLSRQCKFNTDGFSTAIAGGLLKAVAGILFILPGFVSDLGGALLLLPPVGRWLAMKFKPIDINKKYYQPKGPVIEGEIIGSNDNDVTQSNLFPNDR